MAKKLLLLIIPILLGFGSIAQKLISFSETLQPEGKAFLSIPSKKSYSASEAAAVKKQLSLALVLTKDWSGSNLEWYNLSGKDNKTKAELNGTAVKINGISFDRQQFDQCKTTADFKRMTSHITENSFSHFASIGNGEVRYHCFIFQLENGKRGLIYIDGTTSEIKADVKIQE